MAPLAPAAVLAACTPMQTPLSPAGDQAGALLSLLVLMLVVCGGFYLLVVGLLAAGLLRRRATADGAGETQPAGGRWARLLPVWCAAVGAGLTVLALGSFLADRKLAGRAGPPALEVRLTGQQWWWRVEYRDPVGGAWIETANELHLPQGRTTRLRLRTADVIHSAWIPNLAGKIDMIPGRENALLVTPRRLGRIRGQCGEFCGVQHARMGLDVVVEPPELFAAWLARQGRPAAPPTDPVRARGRAVLERSACGGCHQVRGAAARGRIGPDLTHVGGRLSVGAGRLPMSRGALQGWIGDPQALKPGALMPAVSLAPADLDAVAAYLEGLK